MVYLRRRRLRRRIRRPRRLIRKRKDNQLRLTKKADMSGTRKIQTHAIMKAPKSIFYMPSVYRTVMRYTQQFTQYSATNALCCDFFCGNGLWDPHLTLNASDKSAYGHVNMSNFYKKYRTYAAKIRVTPIGFNTLTSVTYNTAEFLWTLVPIASDQTSPIYSDIEIAMMAPYAKSAYINFVSGFSKTKESNYLEQYVDVASIYGINKMAIKTNANFAGDINKNPNNQVVWQLYMQNPHLGASSSVSNGFTYRVDIFYYTEYYNLQDVSTNAVPTAGQTGQYVDMSGGITGPFFSSETGITGSHGGQV